uniref:(California timema) hypothetical protein n=1 Tax=Timema californicum TaxID=61474 RepID=A0A7R9IW85_TIMCA|nr:unnamed protein product [Timema californicum]
MGVCASPAARDIDWPDTQVSRLVAMATSLHRHGNHLVTAVSNLASVPPTVEHGARLALKLWLWLEESPCSLQPAICSNVEWHLSAELSWSYYLWQHMPIHKDVLLTFGLSPKVDVDKEGFPSPPLGAWGISASAEAVGGGACMLQERSSRMSWRRWFGSRGVTVMSVLGEVRGSITDADTFPIREGLFRWNDRIASRDSYRR